MPGHGWPLASRREATSVVLGPRHRRAAAHRARDPGDRAGRRRPRARSRRGRRRTGDDPASPTPACDRPWSSSPTASPARRSSWTASGSGSPARATRRCCLDFTGHGTNGDRLPLDGTSPTTDVLDADLGAVVVVGAAAALGRPGARRSRRPQHGRRHGGALRRRRCAGREGRHRDRRAEPALGRGRARGRGDRAAQPPPARRCERAAALHRCRARRRDGGVPRSGAGAVVRVVGRRQRARLGRHPARRPHHHPVLDRHAAADRRLARLQRRCAVVGSHRGRRHGRVASRADHRCRDRLRAARTARLPGPTRGRGGVRAAGRGVRRCAGGDATHRAQRRRRAARDGRGLGRRLADREGADPRRRRRAARRRRLRHPVVRRGGRDVVPRRRARCAVARRVRR